jgi:general secretion pathway protein G
MKSSARSPRVFFPLERRRGLWGALGRARARWVLAAVLGIVLVVVVRRREERAAAVRATRATIDTAYHALIAYRADHAGACPRDWHELVAGMYLRDLPLDAWGHPLRLTCPGRRDHAGFDLESDGPDAIPGGLDRVE